jgi:hypothetical protein
MDAKEPALTAKQALVISKVLQSANTAAGIRAAGISKTLYYEWLKIPAFKAELERQQKEIITESFNSLKAATGEAVAVLRELLKSREESIRLRTAQTILENVLRALEIEEIECRIARLEVVLKR